MGEQVMSCFNSNVFYLRAASKNQNKTSKSSIVDLLLAAYEMFT